MTDNRNMVLAIFLSLIVLIGWSYLSEQFVPANPSPVKVEDGKVVPIARPQADPTADRPRQLRQRAIVLRETPRVRIQTPSLQGSINLKGAMVDDLTLVRHRQDLRDNSPPIRLFSPLGAPGAYLATFGWTLDQMAGPGFDTVWTADSNLLAPGRPVTLSWSSPDGMRFQQRISVDDGYLFTVRQRVINAGQRPAVVRAAGLVSRSGKSPDPDGWTVHVGPMGYLNGAANYDLDWATLDEAGPRGRTIGSRGGWLGFTDKYWLAALAPVGDNSFDARFTRSASGGYQADYTTAPAILSPNQALTTETRLFAGAKEIDALSRYEDAGIPMLSKAIDWGWFEWFMRPIFDLLNWLFKQVGNFGVAIICLTVIVRLLVFPIAQKGFASMAAMRKVQPKLKAIQERHKDDKQKQQQEMLRLYKEEKINPAAGCLPILIQIPVFYALYKVLMVSVEMRHQPFALWIKDLSAPDPLTPVNLFGLLDFTPPGLLLIGVLPILLGVTMWLQFKLNPAPMDPMQQQIFAIMPWVMIIAMAPFAAGLQLYWVVSNILTIGQQWLLYRKYGLHFSDTHPAATST